ncbi:MAG: hypothetical protein WAM78_14380 [Candidatus Sulfotelmatobacter sp.]
MEALTRLVTDSLARHGFDRPVDPRRLQWSRWSRCDSPHSLLVVPSKPGIFALAEEVMDLGPGNTVTPVTDREGHDFSRAVMQERKSPAFAAEEITDGNHRSDCVRRMLAVLQFSEDDDMAFTLDRMFTRINPMRDRLATGRCFLRFVVIEDQAQRRSICAALNQWMLSSSEKASGLPADFQSSLEFAADVARVGTARVGRTLLSDNADTISSPAGATQPPQSADIISAPHLDSGANKNLHCPHPLPSGF